METNELVIDSPLGFIQLQEQHGKLCLLKFFDEKPVEPKDDATEFLLGCAGQLMDYFNGNLKSFRFLEHIFQPGTSFQQKVWNELVNIPYGNTISYLQLAIKLGDEKCIRAAASANAKNNIAIAIPCHRVIGSDGSLVGYAGKLWRKKWLLEHEAKFSGRSTQAILF
jgi:methylated-DNA-[protein]-cysteine S-methyltransferase